jgi:thiosulfate dehydrogenase [quinone] large subunit
MTGSRRIAIPIGILAAALLIILFNPWVEVEEGTLREVLTVAFWLSFIVLLVALFQERREAGAEDVEIEGPAFTRFLFLNSRAGMFWLPIRLFLGFAWLEAGWHKLTSDGWINNGGSALAGFWKAAAAVPDQGRPAITYEWYRDFINVLLQGHHEAWFAWLITFGEIAVGLGLLFGALTGFAAFFGALMNMSFLLAGSASTNPVLFAMAIGIILAWRVAGYYGLDRYLLPALGAPWRPGAVFHRAPAPSPATS